MTTRLTLAAVLVAAATGGAARAAAAPNPIGHLYARCGEVTVAGHSWQYGTKGLACAAAKAVVRRLGGASRAAGPAGVFAGMQCFYAHKGVQAVINCLGPKHLMLAVRPK
jgi:hypothetical protein